MFKSKKMREIVEAHLRQIETLLKHAEEHGLEEAKTKLYISKNSFRICVT